MTLQTRDGIVVHGNLHLARGVRSDPLLLLFHQAGGEARGEYGALVPRLLARGFNLLAIDQRNGGDQFGFDNRTVVGLGGREFSYCEAYPDLEAALAYALENGLGGPRIAWGSSYSAALVFELAAHHGADLAGVIAFSPAASPRLAACQAVSFAERLKIPALALRPESEMAIESSRLQFAAFERLGIRTHVAAPAVHGSSMLDPARVEGDVGATWDVVLTFLDDVVAGVAGAGAPAPR